MSINAIRADGQSASGMSIFLMLDMVMAQVEYHCFADLCYKHIDPLYKDLCLIVAEVMLLNHDSIIRINGVGVSALLVQDVFSQIRNHHVQLVFDNFQNVSVRVINKKAYLRTALYNVVFEYEASFVNNMPHL
jgi:hypothetical protein